MKKIFLGALVFLGAAAYCAAAGIAEEARAGNERADVSYALGMALATDILMDSPLEFNVDAFIRGVRDVVENRGTRFTLEEAIQIIQSAYIAAHATMGERNLAEGQAFLAENARRPGVVTTPSGLQYEVIVEGTGAMPAISDVVLVHYTGTTIDGTVFDTTMDDGMPVEIPLDMVIPGWSEGLRMMREGGRAILFIPPHLAYGEGGAGGLIEPNATLIFEVELISIARFGDGE
ncbi:MAG: FKBP-type peptidyl-prolyl cis-trans isomerase [Treponema sp.]|nr:FKBP-type peptidyl-prolyl cis-trans isomerase [Treponema sp.]